MSDLPRYDQPQAGFYQTKLRKGAVYVGVHLWFGPLRDPWTNEEMDRSWRWQATVNGRHVWDIYGLWARIAGSRITEAEYKFLMARTKWAQRWGRAEPFANPSRPVNWLTDPPPQFRP